VWPHLTRHACPDF